MLHIYRHIFTTGTTVSIFDNWYKRPHVPHTCHYLDNTHHRGQNSTALHVQLVTELYLYRLRIFNKIEVVD